MDGRHRHSRIFRRLLRNSIVLPFVLMIVLCGVLFYELQAVVTTSRWVDHSEQVIAKLNLAEKLMGDVEMGLRGYLLTGEKVFLEPYSQGLPQLDASLSDLKDMVSDNSQQTVLLAQLQESVGQWKQFAKQTLDKPPRPLLPVLLQNKQKMDALRLSLAATRVGEERLRQERYEHTQESVGTFYLLVFVLALLTAASIGFISTRSLKRLNAGYDALITDLEQKAEELSRSNHDLEQFAYTASHDLKEPMRTVSLNTQLLERSLTQLAPKEARYLKFIKEGVDRMRERIDGVLALSQVGKSVRFEEVDCKQVVEDVLKDLKPLVEESHAEITIGTLPKVKGVGVHLKQLFQNLVDNALKFRKPGEAPRVTITSERNGSGWNFRVSDNGIGINQNYHEKVFQMFERLHSAEEYAGSGMGLAICQKIAQLHGGEIKIHSAENEGCTFTFSLPGITDERITA